MMLRGRSSPNNVYREPGVSQTTYADLDRGTIRDTAQNTLLRLLRSKGEHIDQNHFSTWIPHSRSPALHSSSSIEVHQALESAK